MTRKHLFLLIITFILAANTGCSNEQQFGSVIDITGTAQHLKKNSKEWKCLKVNSAIYRGDSIRTDSSSWLEVKFDKSTIKLEEKSIIYIIDSTIDGQRAIIINNVSGGVLSSIHDLDTLTTSYKVITPTSVAQAKGTHYMVFYEPVPRITQINVFSGRVSVFNPLHPIPPIFVLPGFFTTVNYSYAPFMPARLNHGQLKKMKRILGPSNFNHYNKAFIISPSHKGHISSFPGPDKHFIKDLNKVHGKQFKKGNSQIRHVPVPVPGGHVKGGRGKVKGKK